MRFLIAGYGSIGRRHLRNLLALGEQDIILLRSHRSTLSEEEIANFPVETDLHTALAHHPDAVIIANPTALHMQVAVPAAEAGCAILMEKPVSHTLTDVEALREAMAANHHRLVVGFQFRFHPTLRLVAQKIADGEIGVVQSARAHWGEYLPGWHPWEDFRQGYAARADLGGGVILTLSHPFDYLRWLLGDVEAVWAFLGASGGLDLPVEDSAEVGFRFASGAIGSLHLDYLQQPATHTLEVIGAKGTLRWDNATGALSVFTPEQGWQIRLPPEGFERNWLFMEEMRHFIRVTRGEELSVCSLEDGIRALELALAARQSGQSGQMERIEV